MSASPAFAGDFLKQLRAIAGAAQVLTDPVLTRPYRSGFRFGGGPALAVVRPRSLVEMWRVLDARGAEYPAEHNVGHLYKAKPVLEDFYRSLDPCNSFNPGIGQTSKRAFWR
jgi:FAD/FMN-containing dehydrogenase